MEPWRGVQAGAIHRATWKGGEEREFHSLLRWQTIVSRRTFGTRRALSLSRRAPADVQVRGGGSGPAAGGGAHDGAHGDAGAFSGEDLVVEACVGTRIHEKPRTKVVLKIHC